MNILNGLDQICIPINKIDLIMDVFDKRDADIILNTPLNSAVEDSWYWRREKLRNYLVKSVYLLLQELKHNHNTTPNSGF